MRWLKHFLANSARVRYYYWGYNDTTRDTTVIPEKYKIIITKLLSNYCYKIITKYKNELYNALVNLFIQFVPNRTDLILDFKEKKKRNSLIFHHKNNTQKSLKLESNFKFENLIEFMPCPT